MTRYAPFLLALVVALPLTAQRPTRNQMPPLRPQAPVGDTSIFAPLHFRSANEYRTGGGMAGHAYWQNRADYDIATSLDTAQRSVSGRETLTYTNNSPDTLRFIWLQTEQNAFRKGSLNGYIFAQGSRFGARGFDGGDNITKFDQLLGNKRIALKPEDHGTVTKVVLTQPLAPGHRASFDIAWNFRVPEHGADRMGYDGPLFEIAQWYPRVAVYDDVQGWNTDPYLGQGEFYLEYGTFNLSITVPAGYIVAATGTLTNPDQVLTATQRRRLAMAAKSDTTIAIITAAELKDGSARPTHSGTQTWKFHADSVRDAVWAASPDYQWDASSWEGHLAMAYYRPSAVATWSDAADQARMSIMEYSERWYPYAYPQISAVEGPISGMEYPMLAMETKGRSQPGLYSVVTHEIGHMWYPMMVGSNERRHMWQDEGFNTFINTFSEGRRYPKLGTQEERADRYRHLIEQVMRAGIDHPIEINPDRIAPNFLGISAYIKPSVGLDLLRTQILGPDTFDEAFRAYTRRWVFKHPTPTDFFRTMRDVSGHRLDWFWREWFYENDRFDEGVDSVITQQVADSQKVIVTYGNHERGVLPILAHFSFDDGSSEDFKYPAEVWSTNSVEYKRGYTFVGKKLTGITLDPDQKLVDIDRSNNEWKATAGS